MCLLLRSSFHLAILPYSPASWSDAEIVVLMEGSPISTEELCQSDHWVLGHLPEFGRTLGIVLVVPNFFHLRMMEATVFLGTCNVA